MTKIAGILGAFLLASVFIMPCASGQMPQEPFPLNSQPDRSLKYLLTRETRLNYQKQAGLLFEYADYTLWQYLRQGLSYLESPSPESPPERVPPAYLHPDGLGYGAYGLTAPAYSDVRQFYPFFKKYSWQEILRSGRLYELASQAFADRLLKNLRGYLDPRADHVQTFNLLQQVWNLGFRGFKEGRQVVASRTKRAKEFIAGRLKIDRSNRQ